MPRVASPARPRRRGDADRAFDAVCGVSSLCDRSPRHVFCASLYVRRLQEDDEPPLPSSCRSPDAVADDEAATRLIPILREYAVFKVDQRARNAAPIYLRRRQLEKSWRCRRPTAEVV